MFKSLSKPLHGEYRPSFQFKNDKISKSNRKFLDLAKKDNYKINAGDTTIEKLYLNEDGSIDYNKTIATSLNSQVQANFDDTIPLKTKFPNLVRKFPRIHDDNVIQDTKRVIEKLLTGDVVENKVEYIDYKQNNIVGNNDDKTKTIQVHTLQQDPLLPPKFKLKKNRHRPPSPPPPILKPANTEKLSKEEKDYWNIPSAISNWKNNQGFTIALDKRVANDAQNAPDVNLAGFGQLSQALDDAEKKARQEIKIRNDLLKQKALRDAEEKEMRLKQLIDITRKERMEKNDRKRPYNTYDDNKRMR